MNPLSNEIESSLAKRIYRIGVKLKGDYGLELNLWKVKLRSKITGKLEVGRTARDCMPYQMKSNTYYTHLMEVLCARKRVKLGNITSFSRSYKNCKQNRKVRSKLAPGRTKRD